MIREIVHSLDYMYGVDKVLGIEVSWLMFNFFILAKLLSVQLTVHFLLHREATEVSTQKTLSI